jgi:hypothetical protein
MTVYTEPGKTASKMMWHACRGGGSPYVNCQCNIDHSVDATEDEYDNGDYESIGFVELDGLVFVDGCEGCEKKLAKYEHFIWDNRDIIRRYLKTRVDQEKVWADQEASLNVLAGI